MSVGQCEDKLIGKQDVKNLAILIAIALAIGIYLILTTVLISKDGVFYIERAQQLASDPVRIIKAHPPGYPFLIMAAHKCATLFTDDTSVFTWIYAAQGVTLLCRLLALIPLYLIGKLFVGSRQSFWGVLILILLPYPAQIGCDVVREWPCILFLAVGFLLLLLSSKNDRWWAFGLVGLISGLGYLIRPESALLVLYGLGWLIINFFCGITSVARKCKLICGGVLLVAGFTIFAGPYMKLQGQIVPDSLKGLLQSSTVFSSSEEVCQELPLPTFERKVKAALIPTDILRAFGHFFNSICETVMFLFAPPLFFGYLHYFRRKGWLIPEKFYMSMFTFLTMLLFILIYCKRGRNSARHIIPLVSMTIFFIPVGLQIIADWFGGRLPKDVYTPDMRASKEAKWFYSIIIIGIIICMPKLFRPIRIDKQEYREVATWLRDNTSSKDSVTVTDHRINFYADRKRIIRSEQTRTTVRYVVVISKEGDSLPGFVVNKRAREEFVLTFNKGNKKLVIYKIIRRLK